MTAVALPHEGAREFIGRTWSAYAALGAGLVLLALGSEHLGPLPVLGTGLAALGLVEVLWAVVALRGPLPTPRAALALVLVGGVGWLVTAVLVDGVLTGADVAAGGLQLAAGVLIAVALPRASVVPSTTPATEVGTGSRLAALAVGSLLVATVTVPGLAATDAGEHAHMPGMSSTDGTHVHG